MAKTVGFYQNFNLTLQRLSSALRCVQTNPKSSHVDLADCMGVNQPVAEGFSAWLRHAGLTTAGSDGDLNSLAYDLTPFGALVSQYDPELSDLGTLWVLHYYLATKHAECSDAWNIFINQFLSPGQTFVGDQFQSYFTNIIGQDVKNRSALEKDPKSVLYTYTQPSSLGRLGILNKVKTIYKSQYPNLPHTLVIGYMLFDFWHQSYAQTNTLRLTQLFQEEGCLGRLCQVDIRHVKQFVVDLTTLGYLSFSETQHEPVIRLYDQPPHILLEKYYKER